MDNGLGLLLDWRCGLPLPPVVTVPAGNGLVRLVAGRYGSRPLEGYGCERKLRRVPKIVSGPLHSNMGSIACAPLTGKSRAVVALQSSVHARRAGSTDRAETKRPRALAAKAAADDARQSVPAMVPGRGHSLRRTTGAVIMRSQ